MTRTEAAELLFAEASKRTIEPRSDDFRKEIIDKLVAGDQLVLRAVCLTASPKGEAPSGDVVNAYDELNT